MAKSFARAGCKVAVLDLRLEKAKAVEDEIRAEGFSDVISLAIDVAKKEDFEVALKQNVT
jgi:NAD(P)-dependent dehydrogenase (short-subunit alcohol dehydrogenase family)